MCSRLYLLGHFTGEPWAQAIVAKETRMGKEATEGPTSPGCPRPWPGCRCSLRQEVP